MIQKNLVRRTLQLWEGIGGSETFKVRLMVSAMLASTHQCIDISLRTADATDRCGRGGTLEQFWEESQKPNNGRILNVLDIPMRMTDVRHIRGYQ